MIARVPPVPISIPRTWIKPPRGFHVRTAGIIISIRGAKATEYVGSSQRDKFTARGNVTCVAKSIRFARHQEERTLFENGVLWAEPFGVVLFFDVDNFLSCGDGLERNVVVMAVPEDDEPPADIFQQKVQGEIAVGHGCDRVDGIGVAAADEIAELLVDDIDSLALVELGREIADSFGDDVTDAPEVFVAESVCLSAFEDHFAAFEHGAFRDENDGIAAGILTPVSDEEFGEKF